MDRQEIFDTVVAHLRKQNSKSRSYFYNSCRYRGDNSTKCAIGCLIPDEVYSPRMENQNLNLILAYRGLSFLRENEKILLQLQLTHDVYEVKDWEREFKKIATNFNLKI